MGLNYPQRIELINKNYYYGASDSGVLTRGIAEAQALCKERLNESNLVKCKRILCRIELKQAVIEFITETLSEESEKKFNEKLDAVEAEFRSTYHSGEDLSSSLTILAISALRGRAKSLSSVFATVLSERAKLIGDNGEFKGNSIDFYRLSEELSRIEGSLSEIDFLSPFPKSDERIYGKFAFVDGIPTVKTTVNGILEEVKTAFLRKADVDLKKITIDSYLKGKDSVIYTPSMRLTENERVSQVLFVSTPLTEEFDLLIYANCFDSRSGAERKVTAFASDWVATHKDTSAETVEKRFSSALAVADINSDTDMFVVYGLNRLPDAQRDGIFIACAKHALMRGKKVYFVFHDTSGELELYNRYSELEAAAKEMPDAENKFLSLPQFEDVRYELTKEGFSPEEADYIRKSAPFIGFNGLNAAVRLKRKHNDLWKSEVKELSEQNKRFSLEFIRNLNVQENFIPADWQWKDDLERKSVSQDEGYDYDKIRDVSDAKIEQILSNPEYDIYRRVGSLCVYVLLADEDVSNWENGVISLETKEKRIARAIRLCCFAMGTHCADPEVEFSDETDGGWGARCCHGGKKIVIKRSCIEGRGGFQWTCGTIPHELFHSVQHTLTDYNAPPGWYKRTYHLSDERIATWRDNFSIYTDIDNNRNQYMVQAVETDARDFESFCLGDIALSHTRLN